MTSEWSPLETNKHQDHVIAHVRGASVLGHFSFDEVAYVLLDIGFIWTLFVDGEMGLLPQAVAISELEVEEETKAKLSAEIQSLHDEGRAARSLACITASPVDCLITDVSLYADEDRRRILVSGEEASLAIETSLATGAIRINPA
ncbi:MAG TPA: hypothetical protein VF723_00295 [Pyrinomonadaceae bacterium]|jgi:hypothetical protein